MYVSRDSEDAFEVMPWDLARLFAEQSRREALPRSLPSGAPAEDAPVGIIDLTARADKSRRAGPRDPKKVHSVVLHQMACCHYPPDPMTRFASLRAHFGILPDGRILLVHPIDQLIWASNGLSPSSVAVEFAGNFPDTRGRWWAGDTMGKNQLTAEQVSAGRRLIQHLAKTGAVRQVLAHRQAYHTRVNDPGPDVWYHVGQWAIDNLGLRDAGPGFKLGSGNPIPDLWRTWGKGRAAPAPFRKPAPAPATRGKATPSKELEEEVIFGPLEATLTWLGGGRLYTPEEVRALGDVGGGGVYIARCAPSGTGYLRTIAACHDRIRKYDEKLAAKLSPQQQRAARAYQLADGAKIKTFGIIKVGMADNFARRVSDKEHIDLAKFFENNVRYHLAQVDGRHGRHGVAGVVRMVEFALARLARRARHLDGPSLPRVQSRTLGAVRIEKVLPPALLTLLRQSGGMDASRPDTLTLAPRTLWEAERAVWA